MSKTQISLRLQAGLFNRIEAFRSHRIAAGQDIYRRSSRSDLLNQILAEALHADGSPRWDYWADVSGLLVIPDPDHVSTEELEARVEQARRDEGSSQANLEARVELATQPKNKLLSFTPDPDVLAKVDGFQRFLVRKTRVNISFDRSTAIRTVLQEAITATGTPRWETPVSWREGSTLPGPPLTGGIDWKA